MSIRQEIEQAIVTLEAQRAALSEDVANVAITTLRSKLAALVEPLPTPRQAEGAVLIADMSGFTTMSELMDAEEVRDMINAVWQKLDSVIDSWGGRVDKHVGDAVIAFFGLPIPREDDRERAVQAALDMQMELALFNDGPLRQMASSLPQNQALRMRIGIHYGSVLLGSLDSSGEYTILGDTVTVAHQLEQQAPVGGVLVSPQVYESIHPFFDAETQMGLTLNGQHESGQAYVIVREKPLAFRRGASGTSFLETRMVGRSEEVGRLQDVLQGAIESGEAQVVTVVGKAGLGKTRLLFEFERLLRLWPDQVEIYKGGTERSVQQRPYSLIRDLFVNHFEIHRRNSPAVAREKLVRGLLAQLKPNGEETRSLTQAHYIGQLLGFDFSDSPLLADSVTDPRLLREYAFEDLVTYFTAVCQQNDAVVLFLEDIHWADEWSFDLLEYLIAECHQLPLLIICLARPELLEKRPSWRIAENHNQQTYHHIDLQPLSFIDSRHLLSELLQHVDQMPLRLTDMIVNGAGGNPHHLAELVKMLIQADVIDASGSRWYVRMAKLADLPPILSLPRLIGNQLENMSKPVRMVVQRAAVMGPFFWDMVLLQLSAEDEMPLNWEGLTAVLGNLVDLGWIYRRKNSAFSGTQEYAFGNDELRTAAYDSLTEQERQSAHARVAAWFVTHDNSEAMQLAGMVAYHLEQAEKFGQGAVWYGRAAKQARIDNAPETAVLYYCQALNLLPVSAETAVERVSYNEGLGEMLRWLAQFEDATDAYLAMTTAAESIQDKRAVVRAHLGLFLCYFLQDDLTQALNAAQHADRVATAAKLTDLQLITQVAIGWVLVLVGDQHMAVQIGKTLYNNLKGEAATLPRAYMQALLGHIARESGHFERALNTTETARQRFREKDDRIWEALMLAQLGHITRDQRDWETAVNNYKTCLHYARDLGDVYGTVLALRHLGMIAMHQGQYDTSEGYLQQALIQADKSNNELLRMQVSCCLGQLHLLQAVANPQSAMDLAEKETHLQLAYNWWEQTLRRARMLERPLSMSTAVAGLAQLFLEDHLLDEALGQAQTAVEMALSAREQQNGREARRVTAVAWRVLGMVLAKEPTKNRQTTVQQHTVSAADCFRRSHQLLTEMGSATADELLLTLNYWAKFERLRDDNGQAHALAEEAMQIAQQYQLTDVFVH
ncbi:ATP-binding protein [Candidatus Leptofilum sp.]|uniref:ATP-binding protein n=1 Tax=Candidatus Leptofilum sp. TaxID=3241576 RepID=UPI003B5C5D71